MLEAHEEWQIKCAQDSRSQQRTQSRFSKMQKCLQQTPATASGLLHVSRSESRGVRCFQTGTHKARAYKQNRGSARPQITCQAGQSQPKPVKAAAVRLLRCYSAARFGCTELNKFSVDLYCSQVQDRPDTKLSDVVKWGQDKRLQTQVLIQVYLGLNRFLCGRSCTVCSSGCTDAVVAIECVMYCAGSRCGR